MLPPPSPSSARAPTAAGIDWRTVFMLLPQRRFTAEELRRAIPGPMNLSIRVSVALNLAVPTVALAWAFGREAPWVVSVALVAIVVMLGWVGVRAWADPSAPVVRLGYWLLPLASGLTAGWLVGRDDVPRTGTVALAMVALIGSLSLWFVIVHRHQYVQMRLAELAERERAVEMARRLAAAQLEPHFLFNTLASLQHWVATRDERAAPLLEALTGYLRATLPMFVRPTLPLADEAEAVRRYLQVMQARLGARLAWQVQIDPALQGLPVPPGLLLTLVENAVEHGIEPLIAGGEVRLRAATEGTEAVLVVEDNGAGPAGDAQEGIGLTNVRERLALTHGATARLSIARAPAGGCRAELRLPLPPPGDPTVMNAADQSTATSPLALVADDEEAPREQLVAALRQAWPGLRIESAVNGVDAWDRYLELEPDLCLLDIRMPGLSGIEVARRIAGRTPVVFVSAFGDHALAAFDAGAVDYVLKPVESARLVQALDRLRQRLGPPPPAGAAATDAPGTPGDAQLAAAAPAVMQALLERLAAEVRRPAPPTVLQAAVGREVRLIRVDEVLFFESDARYTRVVTADGDALIRTPLKELLAQLDEREFWQVHRSVIVNHRHIASAVRVDEGHMHLTLRGRPEKLPVSRHFQALFKGQ